MTRSKAFSTVVAGLQLLLNPGQTATYTVTVANTKTFTGLLLLERSRNGGQSWETVASFDGRSVTITAGSTTATVENQTGGRELYRFRCKDAGGADAITGAITDAADAEQIITDKNGDVVATVNRDGSLTIVNATITTATITTATITNIAALLQAWAATLPATDPAVAGQLFVKPVTFAITVSQGA